MLYLERRMSCGVGLWVIHRAQKWSRVKLMRELRI